jgi:ABC-2 type transport system ATP-binding protein
MKAIEIQNLTKHFGSTKAVDDISFSVEQGQIFGFLGPNGAGKTTTIRMMMDFIRPDSGTATILGKDAQRDETCLKKEIGFLSGEVHLYDNWTGEQHIALSKKLNGKEDRSAELVRRFNLDTTKKAKNLSSGNKQKLGLVLAFMARPQLIILDEPTNGLDPLLQKEVYSLIQETVADGATVFMSSHNLPEVERVCDHVGIIRQGKIIAEESIASLKQKKIYSVKIVYEKEFNYKEVLSEKDEHVQDIKNGFVLNIKGDINLFLQKIANHSVHDIEISQASLEDIFLEYYQK